MMIVLPSLLSFTCRYGICRCFNSISSKSNCFSVANVSINEFCTRIRTCRIGVDVGGTVRLISVVSIVVVVGKVIVTVDAVVMFEISSSVIVVADGMTRDDDQSVPE